MCSDSVQVTVVSREDQLVDIEDIKNNLEAKAEDLKAKRKVHEEAVRLWYFLNKLLKQICCRWRSIDREDTDGISRWCITLGDTSILEFTEITRKLLQTAITAANSTQRQGKEGKSLTLQHLYITDIYA